MKSNKSLDDSVQLLMNMSIEKRYLQLKQLMISNDPKVILRLTDEWETQAKISLALCSIIRAEAHNKRGSEPVVDLYLKTIENLTDIFLNGPELQSTFPVKVLKNENATFDVNQNLIALNIQPDSLLARFGHRIGSYGNISQIIEGLEHLNHRIRVGTDELLQGRINGWNSGNSNNEFDYFPLDLSLRENDEKLTDLEKSQIVNELIKAICKVSIPKISTNHLHPIITMGSCFAVEIQGALRRNSIECHTFRLEESINTAFANEYLLRSIIQQSLHPKLKELFPDDITEKLKELHNYLLSASAIILTVGVSAVVVDAVTEEIKYQKSYRSGFEDGTLKMRFTTVYENKEAIVNIVNLIKEINPSCQIFITLSPVPLIGVPSEYSVIERDVISKSTLRLAIEEASKEVDFTYFPSFEAVKWIAPHIKSEIGYQSFGDPDNNSRHVSRWLVDEITKSFIEHVIDFETDE